MNEKSIEHECVIEKPWDRQKSFSDYPLPSDLPVLVDKDGVILEGWYAIVEHLEQGYKGKSFFGMTLREKAEARRLTQFFNETFYTDVVQPIVFEKIMRRHTENRSPDSASIRKGTAALKEYMEHISWFADHRNWLAGTDMTLADISAAAQISCIDYTGTVDWEQFPSVKEWYARIKSRPSFREILQDKVPEISPTSYYCDLDF